LELLFRILAPRKDKAHPPGRKKHALFGSVRLPHVLLRFFSSSSSLLLSWVLQEGDTVRLPHVLLRFFSSSSSSLLSWVLQEGDTAGRRQQQQSKKKKKKKGITFENPTPRELRSVANCFAFTLFASSPMLTRCFEVERSRFGDDDGLETPTLFLRFSPLLLLSKLLFS